MERSKKVIIIRAGIWMPRKVGAVSQVNNKGRHDEENFAPVNTA